MGLAVEWLPLTLHWKKLYISGRSKDNDNLLGKRVQGESRTKLAWFLPNRSRVYEIDYGSSHIVALQRSSERRKTKQGEERCQPFPLLTYENRTATSDFYSTKSPGNGAEA